MSAVEQAQYKYNTALQLVTEAEEAGRYYGREAERIDAIVEDAARTLSEAEEEEEEERKKEVMVNEE